MKGRVTCLYHVHPLRLVLPASELDGTDVRTADETARKVAMDKCSSPPAIMSVYSIVSKSESNRGKEKLVDNGFHLWQSYHLRTDRPTSFAMLRCVDGKLRGCRCRRVRVRRRNGRCRDVPVPRSPSAETVSAETMAPRRWRRNGGAEMSCSELRDIDLFTLYYFRTFITHYSELKVLHVAYCRN